MLPVTFLLVLLIGWALPTRAGAQALIVATGEISVPELTRLRRAHLDYWRQLGSQGVGGLERFARTVQRVVDARAGRVGAVEETIQLVLDDLVDLFVSAEYQFEKTVVMSTASVLGENAISEEAIDLDGFAERFRSGEGRFRHFVLNAAAVRSTPDVLVELAARLRGHDLLGTSPDSVADRATNGMGRAFTRLLRERPLTELGDGITVRDWIVERFGE